MSDAKSNIVETAVASGDFKTLVTAIKAADLAGVLAGPGPFTVFAPSEAAFAKLPAGSLDGLLKPDSKARLAAILKRHVVPGKLMASDFSGKTSKPATVHGDMVTIDGSNGVTVNGAKVTKADIVCSNGVIHVIDTVMMPVTATPRAGT
jgi:uncharacterized surface protein with fasciclin (FAS1) repeats